MVLVIVLLLVWRCGASNVGAIGDGGAMGGVVRVGFSAIGGASGSGGSFLLRAQAPLRILDVPCRKIASTFFWLLYHRDRYSSRGHMFICRGPTVLIRDATQQQTRLLPCWQKLPPLSPSPLVSRTLWLQNESHHRRIGAVGNSVQHNRKANIYLVLFKSGHVRFSAWLMRTRDQVSNNDASSVEQRERVIIRLA